MSGYQPLFEQTSVPTDRPREVLDVRTLGPPQPLARTLERLAASDDDLVLIQRNDRAPQFLYPKLEDRGYTYETVETEMEVVTVIWRE
ncbi:DUF2249 domain-containing protein [Natronosalvus vescus]|uniref:DUF2249 domain-containing protein n=1 Tax=Natronosalvus vescus TaxID=2953881 RepID=UPI002091A8C5|nr:DUF2249 domain-containing protein [Natronosalvus vescus]